MCEFGSPRLAPKVLPQHKEIGEKLFIGVLAVMLCWSEACRSQCGTPSAEATGQVPHVESAMQRVLRLSDGLCIQQKRYSL